MATITPSTSTHSIKLPSLAPSRSSRLQPLSVPISSNLPLDRRRGSITDPSLHAHSAQLHPQYPSNNFLPNNGRRESAADLTNLIDSTPSHLNLPLLPLYGRNAGLDPKIHLNPSFDPHPDHSSLSSRQLPAILDHPPHLLGPLNLPPPSHTALSPHTNSATSSQITHPIDPPSTPDSHCSKTPIPQSTFASTAPPPHPAPSLPPQSPHQIQSAMLPAMIKRKHSDLDYPPSHYTHHNPDQQHSHQSSDSLQDWPYDSPTSDSRLTNAIPSKRRNASLSVLESSISADPSFSDLSLQSRRSSHFSHTSPLNAFDAGIRHHAQPVSRRESDGSSIYEFPSHFSDSEHTHRLRSQTPPTPPHWAPLQALAPTTEPMDPKEPATSSSQPLVAYGMSCHLPPTLTPLHSLGIPDMNEHASASIAHPVPHPGRNAIQWSSIPFEEVQPSRPGSLRNVGGDECRPVFTPLTMHDVNPAGVFANQTGPSGYSSAGSSTHPGSGFFEPSSSAARSPPKAQDYNISHAASTFTDLAHHQSQGTGSTYSRSSELKISHKLAERKRRREMKDLFDELKLALPVAFPAPSLNMDGQPHQSPEALMDQQRHLRNAKASKWEILNRAVEFLHHIRSENEDLKDENRRLRGQMNMLLSPPSPPREQVRDKHERWSADPNFQSQSY